MSASLKRCGNCQAVKWRSDFHNKRNHCKECEAAHQRAYKQRLDASRQNDTGLNALLNNWKRP